MKSEDSFEKSVALLREFARTQEPSSLEPEYVTMAAHNLVILIEKFARYREYVIVRSENTNYEYAEECLKHIANETFQNWPVS